jgi:predicted transposase YdaD
MTFEMLMEEKFEAGVEKGIKQGIEKGIAQGIAKGREEGREEGITKGLEQGAYNNKLETAKKLLAMSLTLEKIAEATSLPLETVLELETKK